MLCVDEELDQSPDLQVGCVQVRAGAVPAALEAAAAAASSSTAP